MSLSNLKNEQLIERAEKLGITTTGLDRSQLIQSIKQHESSQVPETHSPKAGQQATAPLPDSETAGVTAERPSRSPLEDPLTTPNALNPTTDRCWFRVAAGQRADEKGSVFAAINGESILIHRNTWVQLPMKFLPVFRDALTSEVVIMDDARSMVRDVPRFNYEIRSLSEGKPKESQLPVGF